MTKGVIMKPIALAIAAVLILAAVSAGYDRGYVYVGGRVESLSREAIVVSGNQYTVSPNCKVFMQSRERNAIHERPSSFYSIRVGDSVYVRLLGTLVEEIRIEGWKR